MMVTESKSIGIEGSQSIFSQIFTDMWRCVVIFSCFVLPEFILLLP